MHSHSCDCGAYWSDLHLFVGGTTLDSHVFREVINITTTLTSTATLNRTSDTVITVADQSLD